MTQQKTDGRKAEILLIASTSLSLFGGRWISYIGLPNLNFYIVDFFFFAGALLLLLRHSKSRKFSGIILLSTICLAYIAIYIFLTPSYSLTLKIRDFAPFIYILVAPIIAMKFDPSMLKLAISSFRFATLAGAIWTDLVMLNILNEFELSKSFFGVPIFSARWDHSGMSICIGIILWGNHLKLKIQNSSIIRIFLAISILLQYSRASLIGLVIVLSYIVFKQSISKSHNFKDNLSKYLAVCSLVIMIFFNFFTQVLPQNSAFSRLGLFENQSVSDVLEVTRNSGTAQARILAQRELMHWVSENNLLWTGAGPGREMLIESGTYNFLSGSPEVRSPHSWVFGSLARFGILGFSLWHFCLVYFLLKQPNSRLGEKLFLVSPILIMVIYVISCFGVIIESPFGLIPLAFFLGANGISRSEYE